jgi:hypothetical protein
MNKRPCSGIIFQVIFFLILCCSTKTLYGGMLPEKCRLTPVNGSCKAMMDRYYFDQKYGLCREYIYDGCGPVVPFDTLEECRALCEPVSTSSGQMKPTEAKPVVNKRSGLYYDPVEDDPRYAEVFKTIDDEVKGLLADHPQRGAEGFVNIYWSIKKSLLERKYNIDWRSPGEMNPHVLFD